MHAAARRLGVARGLYTSLFSVLELQGFRNAYAGITLPNEASVSLHTAVGFKLVGVYHSVGYKNGTWHDTGWFERGLAPHTIAPAPPKALSEYIGTDTMLRALEVGENCFREPRSQ